MLVQHYGVSSVLGRKFSASLEALQLEIGTNQNPLELDFDRYGDLATPCWLKSLWERMSAYNFHIYMKHEEIPFPRERDRLLVEIFLGEEYVGEELRQLNRVRIFLQMLFLSDIATADGRRPDPTYLSPSDGGGQGVNLYFPTGEANQGGLEGLEEFLGRFHRQKGGTPSTSWPVDSTDPPEVELVL